MYVVIFRKDTKRIVKVLEKSDEIVKIGFSDNCDKATVEEKPVGKFFDGEPDPPDPEPVDEIETEEETEDDTETEEETEE